MPRRIKTLFLMVMMFVIGMLVYTSHLRQTQPRDTRTVQDFYYKTKEALNRGRGQVVVDSTSGKAKGQIPVDKDADGDIDEDDDILAKEMADRLRAAEQQAKDLANAKSPNPPDAPSLVVGVGSSAGGQKKHLVEDDSVDDGETGEEHAVEVELDKILKRSPVIIFSKTYCPYSKRAKGVLLEKYAIDPAPYVVELDEHPLGPQLQERLGLLTGRKTVPNIMVNGKSIGGGDDIADLDRDRALEAKIKGLGGKWIDIKARFAPRTST